MFNKFGGNKGGARSNKRFGGHSGGDNGGRFEKRGFGGGRSGGRDGVRSMHKATCGDCGNTCEVPFKPTGDRPVFCNDCFRKDGEGSNRRPEREYEENSFGRSSSRNFGRDSFRDSYRDSKPAMHQAVCDECGVKCEVPFKPSEDKPIFCSDCFKREGGANNSRSNNSDRGGNKGGDQFKEQLDILNIKLDRILKILTSAAVKEAQAQTEPAPKAEDAAPKVKKTKAAKSKKAAAVVKD